MIASALDVTTSKHARPGRPFQPVQEAELHRDLPALVRSLPGAVRHGALLIAEAPGPFGVPDLLVLVGGQRQIDQRLASGLAPILSEMDAGLVAQLSAHRPASVSDLALVLGWTEDAVRRRARRLAGLEVVADRPSGLVRHPMVGFGGSIHAIEAKVNDWNRGIDQSLLYATWCDSVTLSVGRLPRDFTPAVVRAARLRLGLVGSGRWLCRPGRRSHPRSVKQWAHEHVVAALWDHQPSPAI